MQDELERKSIRDEQTPEQIFELRKMSSEQSAYYNVNKEEYDSCLITKTNPRIIAYCTNPMVGG